MSSLAAIDSASAISGHGVAVGSIRPYFEVKLYEDSIKPFSAALHLLQKVGKEVTLGTDKYIDDGRIIRDLEYKCTKYAKICISLHQDT